MAVWSTLARSAGQNFQVARLFQPKIKINNAILNTVQTRSSHGFVVQPTRWQWHLTKDRIHFCVLLGAIPLSIITFCANVFVGPATLTPIPEGYIPEYWEYYRNPITRFLARYIYHNPQKDYEKTLHIIYDESQVIKLRILEKKIWALQEERQDYKYNFFLPYYTQPTRVFREIVRQERDGYNQ